MKDLKKIQEFFSKPLEENTWPEELTSRYSDEYRFELEKVTPTYQDKPGRAKYRVIDIESGELKGTPVFSSISNLQAFADDLIKPQGGTQSTNLGEMDMNDPVLMKMRAAKDKKPNFGKEYGDAVKTAYGSDKNAKKLAFLKKERAQLMRDMEQEAEPEGGPIADEYGSKLNSIDKAIAKLQGRKEMTYDQAIAESESKMPTQSQVDRFFELTQNETHYLNSKPVAGQEKTFNKMEVEPWDEYDLSNWNSLVRKAKAKGKSLDEVKVDYDFSEKELIRVLRQLKRGASTEIDMIKAFTKALGRDITKDELFSESIDEDNSYARVSKPRFIKDKRNPNFLNVYIDYDLGPGGSSIALGKETMTGQIRRLSAAKAMKVAGNIARDLEAEYNLEDIDIQDLENGKVRIFAVSDDFIDMNPNMLGESLNENISQEVVNKVSRFITSMANYYDYSEQDAVYAIMQALRAHKGNFQGLNEATRRDLGMSSSVSKRRAKAELKKPGNDGSKVYGLDKDGKRVHIKSINDVDKFTKFEIDANLNEGKVEDKLKDLFKNDPSPSDEKVHKLADSLGLSPHELEARIYKILGSFLNEAKEEDKIDIVTMDVPLFIRALEYAKEDAQEDMDLHDFAEKAIAATKEQGILQMDDYDMLVGGKEPIDEAVNLKQSKLSSSEYQKAKKLKAFDAKDWKWNAGEGLYIKVVNESVVEKVIAQIKEEKPGLWANIRAKKARGGKPAHGNSNAHKTAVKAGKKINSIKEEVEDNGPEEKSFDAELMAAANGIAATLGRELKAKQGDKEQLDEAIVTSIIAAVLTGNALIGFISKMSKKLAKKLNWKKGEDFAGKVQKWAHDNETAFQKPIKRVLKFFIKDETKLEATTKAIYAVVIMGMAAGYGAEAVSSLSNASWFQASVASLKTIAKGDEAIATAYPVVKSFIA